MASAVEMLIAKLKSGELASYSKLDLFNEKRQTIPKGGNIPRFSYEFKKNSRILFRLWMAVPFDPELGEQTDEFNAEHKWRPPVSPTTAAKLLKYYAQKNAKTHELFMTRASVSEWDVSDPDTLNDVDFKVLRAYRVPMVVTAEAITISDPGITGQDFGIGYSVPIKRDLSTGQILGDMPMIAKIGALMSSVTFAEINELDEAIKAKDPTKYKNSREFINPTAIPAADEKTVKEWKSGIFQKAIMSSVRPQNYLIGLEFRLSPSKTMLGEDKNALPVFTNLAMEDLEGKLVQFNYAGKYKDPILEVLSKPGLDHFWDFVEQDICDSAASDPGANKQAKADASRALKPATPSHSLWNIDNSSYRFPWVEKLIDAISEYGDSDPKFEEKMALFVARQLRALDDTILGIVVDRIQEKMPLSYRYLTDAILRTHKDACLQIYGEDYMSALLSRGLMSELTESEEQEQKAIAVSVDKLIDEIEEDAPEPDGSPNPGAVEATEIKI